METRASTPRARSQAAWPILVALVGVLLASLVALGLRFFRPVRLSNGQWLIATVNEQTWPDGHRSRDLWCCTDAIIRRDWDRDGDGVYDCREDHCPWKSDRRWAACVSYLQDGQWVPAPPELLDCGIKGFLEP
jgi:hypothetical protein